MRCGISANPLGNRHGGIAKVGAWPRGECADSVLPWKSQGRAAGGRGLLLGSPGCNPARLLLSSAGSHCREQCWAGPACSSLGNPSVETLVVLVLHGVPVGAVPFIRAPTATSGHPRRCSPALRTWEPPARSRTVL